ncbi:MAG: NADH-ubiquinone oxidoreductase-F iron-sulfur binding region domain-containing protein [Tepidisphaerales bacterium]
MTEVFLSQDSASAAAGARDVERALRASRQTRHDFDLVFTGSRGAYFLEPMVEVATARGRVAYVRVRAADVGGLLDRGLLEGRPIAPWYAGQTNAIPFLGEQTRVTFERCGQIAAGSLAAYEAAGGFAPLRRALLDWRPCDIIEEIRRSGLRGRGGAAFPAAVKWQTAADADADERFVVANGDEGDSGAYADRMLMEGDPFAILEGMALCAYAINARQGFIYVRAEYPHARSSMNSAVLAAREAGWLGPAVMGSGFGFDVEVRSGAGAYVCGEETALLESLEGRRGVVRPKPPYPATHGLFGKPTVVHNVTTLATLGPIIQRGGDWYASMGTERSKGTIALQLGGALRTPGLVEVPFGISLRRVIQHFGGGVREGRKLLGVQVGGPLGSLLREDQLDIPVDFESLAAAGAMLGHGGIVAYDDRTDPLELAHRLIEFCAHESCGKCAPCRLGSQRAAEILDSALRGEGLAGDEQALDDIAFAMRHASLCALGGMAPLAMQSALRLAKRSAQLAQTGGP